MLNQWTEDKSFLILNDCNKIEVKSENFNQYKKEDYKSSVIFNFFTSEFNIDLNLKKILIINSNFNDNINITCLNEAHSEIYKVIESLPEPHLICFIHDFSKVRYSDFTSPLNILRNENLITLILNSLSGNLKQSVEVIKKISGKYPLTHNLTIMNNDPSFFSSIEEFETDQKSMLKAVEQNAQFIALNNLDNPYHITTICRHFYKNELKRYFLNDKILQKLPLPKIIEKYDQI